MTATRLDLGDLTVSLALDGRADGPPVLFLHALGTDLTLWDNVLPLLPDGPRYIRLDMRGHGASDCPPPPYAMGALIRDTERAMELLGIRDAVVIGLSIGGMIAQGLAVKRLDLVRGLVLSNTAAKIATAETWAARIDAVRRGGMAAVTDQTIERWFSRASRSSAAAQHWRDRLLAQDPQGWIGCAAAIAGTDFYTTTATLTLPTLALAGSEDGSTPADLVRETSALIRGSRFELLRGAGHLPPVDRPEAWAGAVSDFLSSIGQC
ncbi:3-oxoadipate enol-lactonase [Tabrizicola sp. J26]|uniref:3-oxoadipate enol-lactonase n=1 Tax=Alitabrizicola rongguiensis TaxID=2909234 RepID=UPI001F274914|nr:3-oxoadipate enol-lactonase [Tabrizicola rongguiensis]MCF1708790.1 3-oxoadipate enol-lactonase [Tabrizicola rongguiensis]